MKNVNRYDVFLGVEGEYQPGTGKRILKNIQGITKKTVIDRIEFERYIEVRERYFHEGKITSETTFTAETIKDMHRDWLGEIYEWAGEYRSVDMQKGDFQFPPAYLIAENMDRFGKDILAIHTPCRGENLTEICMSIAIVHSELILIHPFREGNGRIARWLAEMMAAQADLPIPDYGFTGKGSRRRKKYYLDAVIKSYRKDYYDLARFFELTISARL